LGWQSTRRPASGRPSTPNRHLNGPAVGQGTLPALGIPFRRSTVEAIRQLSWYSRDDQGRGRNLGANPNQYEYIASVRSKCGERETRHCISGRRRTTANRQTAWSAPLARANSRFVSRRDGGASLRDRKRPPATANVAKASARTSRHTSRFWSEVRMAPAGAPVASGRRALVHRWRGIRGALAARIFSAGPRFSPPTEKFVFAVVGTKGASRPHPGRPR